MTKLLKESQKKAAASLQTPSQRAAERRAGRKRTWMLMKRNYFLYLFILPSFLYILIFPIGPCMESRSHLRIFCHTRE